MAADLSNEIGVFSPGLRLTVTVENGPRGEEIHLDPGGQGYWLARSIERLASLDAELVDALLAHVRVDTVDDVARALTE